MAAEIVVVGSCVMDLIGYTENLPRIGETVIGSKFSIGYGGKGANQCVAAARLGGNCLMVGKLGNDTFGLNYLNNFKSNNVNCKNVEIVENSSTGVAQIIVDLKGANVIVIVPGANLDMKGKDIEKVESEINNCKVVVCQGEIPEATTKCALKLAKKHNVITLMNAAPAFETMDSEIYQYSDIFCVNESEAEILTGCKVESVGDAQLACGSLLSKGCKSVIVTLGENGAVYGTHSDTHHVTCPKVEAIDTTGAGDAFVGALAYFLSNKSEMSRIQMVEKSCFVASRSVQLPGTQASYPFSNQLPDNFV